MTHAPPPPPIPRNPYLRSVSDPALGAVAWELGELRSIATVLLSEIAALRAVLDGTSTPKNPRVRYSTSPPPHRGDDRP